MRIVFALVVAHLLFVACEGLFENTITFDDIHEPELAVTALLDEADSIHQIYISVTLPPTATPEADALSTAEVLVRIEGVEYDFVYNTQSGYYEYPPILPFKTGDEWVLEVRYPELPTITASQRVPNPLGNMQLDTIPINPLDSQSVINSRLTTLQLQFQENPMPNDLYLMTAEGSGVYLNRFDSTYVYKERRPYFINTDEFNQLHNSSGRTYFDDTNINGQAVDTNIRVIGFLDTLYELHIRFSAISEDRYLYDLKNDQFRQAQQNLFTEPVSTYTNVENGVGIFSVSRSFLYVVE